MREEIDATTLAIKESKTNISQYYSDMFDEVSAKYDAILQGYEHTETMLNEYISQAEAQGHIVSKEYYNALIDNEEANIAQLKKEQSALIKARDEAVKSGAIKEGSKEWYGMCAEIDAVTQAIESGTTSLIEYDNAMRQIDWDVFDLKMQGISDVNDEADFLIELMSSKDLYDDKGKLTSQGAATLGLHAQNHNTYMYQADEYGAEIADIDAKIASGEYDANDQEVINRRRELVEAQRESILAAEDEKQAIKDLVADGINKELDALQELIDKKNESLESEKELYEYQKKVQEQTENIASLRKQMAAYENDNSEEAKAKIQELRVSLEEAETELKETEWDKYISDTSALLDTLYTEYETILNTRLGNIDLLLEQVITGINASVGEGGTIDAALGEGGAIASAIANTVSENGGMKSILNSELASVGTTLSSAMSNIWNTGDGNIKSILSTYGQNFQNQQTTTNQTLNGIKASVDKMVNDSDEEAKKKKKKNKTTTSAKADPTKDSGNNKDNNKDEDKKDNKDEDKKDNKDEDKDAGNNNKAKTEKDYHGVALAIWNGNYGWGTGETRKKRLKNKGFDADKVQKIVNKMGKDGYVPTGAWQGKYYGIKDLTPYHYNKFAQGAKNIGKDQLAWTQENGLEYIIRPSDGAILTPITRNDSVLNAEASNNLWNMSNSPAEFIRDNLKLDASNVPNSTNVQSNLTQHFENIVFSMPNVHSYEEMLKQMQKDKSFERLITAMTIDQIAGKSSLAKGKSIR